MLEDLTMIATMPVDEAAVKKAKDEADKDEAAAGETGRGLEPSESEPESEIPALRHGSGPPRAESRGGTGV